MLILLLLISQQLLPVSADPVPFVVLGAVPETAELIIGGVTVVMTGIAALNIAETLGKTWDNTVRGWEQLMKDAGSQTEPAKSEPEVQNHVKIED
ncbi:MAG TPA: hypothetical protein O0X23_01045 [Methanocorpusculum sp.]|nr:hypothetical protein [Methanocorpusculum sp.]